MICTVCELYVYKAVNKIKQQIFMEVPWTRTVDLIGGSFPTMLHWLSSRMHPRFTRGPDSLEDSINFTRMELIFPSWTSTYDTNDLLYIHLSWMGSYANNSLDQKNVWNLSLPLEWGWGKWMSRKWSRARIWLWEWMIITYICNFNYLIFA